MPPPLVPSHKEEGQDNGHNIRVQYRVADGRGSYLHHTLVKGEQKHLKSIAFDVDSPETSDRRHNFHHYQSSHYEYKFSKVYFPKFDGDHPKVWKEKCEKYFFMYHAPIHLWIPLATNNFQGNASLWLQAYKALSMIYLLHELFLLFLKK